MPALARLARADAVWPNVAGDALLFALRGGYAPEAGEETGDQSSETTQELDAEEETSAPARVANNDNDAGAFPTSTLSAILEDTPDVREIVDLPGEGVELTLMDMERLALAKRIKGKKRMQLEPKVVLHEDIRLFAARVLGDLYHAEVAQELADVLNNSDAGLRLAAADSLARIGEHLSPFPDAVTEILMATAVEADRELKLLLIRALAAAGGEAAPAFLAGQLSNQDSFIRTEAVRALTRARRSGPEIEALLDDPDPAVRLCAAQAVAGADGDDAIEMLVNFAFSFEGYHGRETARLLREMDATQASALFVDVLQNPEHKRTWSVAIEALEELNCPRPILNAEIPDCERRG
jgi:HEAT repeat protein